jgi:pilus assembly protein CpaB
MGRRNAIIMLCLAVVLALLASVLTYKWLQKKEVVTEVSKPVLVAVAGVDLSWGTPLTSEMIKLSPYLKDSLPAGYFGDVASLQGRTVIYPLQRGEVILESKLAPTTLKGGGVAAIITPNKRAMTISVDKVVGVSGFLEPGHHVDVLVSLGRRENPITKIVLEDMLVLAAGRQLSQQAKGDDKQVQKVDVVTLEVTPQEAEKLALAANEGNIRLALRNYVDKDIVPTRGETIPTLLAGNNYKKSVDVSTTTRRAVPQKRKYTMTVIRGTDLREVKF